VVTTLTNKIPYDTSSSDIILISYPPGGFGNFIYYLLTEFAEQTVKPDNSLFLFGKNGNSHAVNKYTTTYFHDPKTYQPLIDASLNIDNKKLLVLVDNGWLDNDYQKLHSVFPNAKIVRMCIDSDVYHIIGALMDTKARGAPINVHPREHYGGAGRFRPLPLPHVVNVGFKKFITETKQTFKEMLKQLELTLVNESQLDHVIAEWQEIHKPYFYAK